jgi:hypothetical protein
MGNEARMEDMRNAYKIFVAKPEGRRLLGRPGCRWKDDIRMDLNRNKVGIVNWIHLVHYRVHRGPQLWFP